MTLLSETTIRRNMARDLLVRGGDPAQARGAAYRFRPQLVVPGGGKTQVRLLLPTDPEPSPAPHDVMACEGYCIERRSLVWIRMRETVKLPPDICAFWWQTNSFSRKGLMLVNMSLVEPGYEGPLACLFVNFGDGPIRISATDTVARLVFHTLDEPAPPQERSFSLLEYDKALRDDVAGGSSSFLGIDDFRIEFRQARAREEEILRDTLASEEQKTRERIKEVQKEVTESIKDPKNMLKTLGYAAAGFLLLLLALEFVPWLENLFPNRLRDDVESSVNSALLESDLMKKVLQLEAELEALRGAPPEPPAEPEPEG